MFPVSGKSLLFESIITWFSVVYCLFVFFLQKPLVFIKFRRIFAPETSRDRAVGSSSGS